MFEYFWALKYSILEALHSAWTDSMVGKTLKEKQGKPTEGIKIRNPEDMEIAA